MVWEKFLCNVTLSAPTAAFDVTVGELMANQEAWAVALGCMMEAWHVGRARGVQFGFDDPIRYVTELLEHDPRREPFDAARPPRPSAVRDRRDQRRGRRPQPRALDRHPVQRGAVRDPAPARVTLRMNDRRPTR